MKTLLWLILVSAVAANVMYSLVLTEGPLQLLISIGSGVTALGAAAGLWQLRRSRAARGRTGA